MWEIGPGGKLRDLFPWQGAVCWCSPTPAPSQDQIHGRKPCTDLPGAVPAPSAGGKRDGKTLGRRKSAQRAPDVSSMAQRINSRNSQFPVLRAGGARLCLNSEFLSRTSRIRAWDQMGLSVLLALEESAGKGGISWEMEMNDNKFPESKGAEPCSERSRTNFEGQTGGSHSQLFLPVE